MACVNCDDRYCMACVIRQDHDVCSDDCPICCDINSPRGALAFARKAHLGQFRDGGAPYITHVARVVDACETNDEKVVAALHDVLEDTNVSYYDLAEMGMRGDLLLAVDAITKRMCFNCAGRGRAFDGHKFQEAYRQAAKECPQVFEVVNNVALGDVIQAAMGDHVRSPCSFCDGRGWERREDYLERVKANPLAAKVKIVDARDNRDDDPRPGMKKRYDWVLEQLGESGSEKNNG